MSMFCNVHTVVVVIVCGGDCVYSVLCVYVRVWVFTVCSKCDVCVCVWFGASAFTIA